MKIIQKLTILITVLTMIWHKNTSLKVQVLFSLSMLKVDKTKHVPGFHNLEIFPDLLTLLMQNLASLMQTTTHQQLAEADLLACGVTQITCISVGLEMVDDY